MKIEKMPSVMVLLVFSWLIAILGICSGGYLLVSKMDDLKSFLIALVIILGSLLLAAFIRVFADLGQMVFDLKLTLQIMSGEVNQGLGNLQSQIQTSCECTKGILESFNESVIKDSVDTKKVLGAFHERLIKDNLDTNHALRGIIDNLTRLDLNSKSGLLTLRNILDKINQDTNQMLQGLRDSLDKSQQDAKDGVLTLKNVLDTMIRDFNLTRDILNKSIISSKHDLQTSIREQADILFKNLDFLRNVTECINCDSKDMNQNIHQIKVFFEQIEHHLNLNK